MFASMLSTAGSDPQSVQQPLGESHRALLIVDAHVRGGAGGQELLVSDDIIGVAELAGFQFLHARLNVISSS